MRCLDIKSNLYLLQEEVDLTPEQDNSASESTNHIWIYDRSGSMYGLIGKLTEDLVERAQQIPVGDTLTLGWFSGEGCYNFILKGFKISGDGEDYELLKQAIRKNNTTLNTTCFSEILDNTAIVIQDLSIFSNRYALCFFTDGYPVVQNYQQEINDIFRTISAIQGKITASLLVGYGNYYNKTLMAQMTEALGGALIHSSDLPTFNITLSEFIKNVQDVSGKVRIKVNVNTGDILFGINGTDINIYSVDSEGYILFTPTKTRGKGKNYIYTLTSKRPEGVIDLVKLTKASTGKDTKIESFIKGIYAAIYLLVQKTKTDEALELLSILGDKALIDVVSNAFTNEEYGAAERRIGEAVKSPAKRFINGWDPHYLPPIDAFCVLDALELLFEDNDAYLYPQHKAFNYKRIGVPSVSKEGYPIFEPESDVKCKFSNLVWNESRLNLSVLVNIPGAVKLKKDYRKKGFIKNIFPTFVWRNYTLVKDGFLNVNCLPLSMSEKSFEIFQKQGLIDKQAIYKSSEIYEVHFDNIPIMNRATAEGRTSAKELFTKVYKELELKAELKTLKFLRNSIEPEKPQKITGAFASLTSEQLEYLANMGLTTKGFHPEVEKVEATDFYFAKEFNIKMKGLSSLPKVDIVQAKLDTCKKLTISDELIAEALNTFNSVKHVSDANKLSWLDIRIEDVQKCLAILRKDIQRTKFAIVLGKKWFDEFSNRENNSMELNGVVFSISLEEKKVEI
jgi:hypothetical protein